MQDERDTLKAELAALKAQPTEPAPSMAGEHEPENEPGVSLASIGITQGEKV
jgi:hypothetical protein